MSRDPSMRRWATGALAVVALLASGCGSGAVEGPGEDDAASDQTDDAGGGSGNDDSSDSGGSSGNAGGGGGGGGGNDEGGGDGDTDGDRYPWNLPVGDITPDDAFILYQALAEGCDAAQEEVDSDSDQYRNLSDEQRQLYNAAIAVCRGNIELGRTLFAGAGYDGSRAMCFIYAGVVSVIEQRPPDTSGCPPNPGDGTPSPTESEESTTSTESTSTTEGETTTSPGEGETTTTEATGVGDGGG
jgi:hypothetical protein